MPALRPNRSGAAVEHFLRDADDAAVWGAILGHGCRLRIPGAAARDSV